MSINKKQKGFTLVEGVIALGFVSIAIVVACVIGHFVHKYW